MFLVSIISCCKDDLPDLNLPAKTAEGLNTLGFIVNERIWVNYGERCFLFGGCSENKAQALLIKQPGGIFELIISGAYTVRGKEVDQSFSIGGENITTVGIYTLDISKGEKMKFVANRYAHSRKYYVNSTQNYPVLVINRFDTVNNVIAGEFKGILYNPAEPSDIVEIKEGRFDIELEYKK